MQPSCSVSPVARLSGSAPTAARAARARSSSDRLELLERLAAALAVAQRAARCRAEDVLEPRLRRAAVGAAEDIRLQLDELRCACLPRCGRREARLAELLAAGRRDPVGRPRVVGHDLDLRL